MKKLVLLFLTVFVYTLQIDCNKSDQEIKEMPITTISEESLKLIKEGRELVEESNPKFVEYFEKAVKLDSTCALAFYHLAFGQSSAEKFFFYLNKANELVENASEGEKYFIHAAFAEYGKRDYSEAEKYLEKLTYLYPDDKRVWNDLGTYYFRRENYKLAIENYQKSIRLDSNFADPYNTLGYCYSNLGKYDNAEKSLKKYAELLPQAANPHDSYAEILMKQGKFDESIKEYQTALSIDPNFYASFIGLGTNYVFKGNYEKGREQLRKLIDAPNDNYYRNTAFEYIAYSYVFEKKYDDAVNELQKSYNQFEMNKNYWDMSQEISMIGDILLESGRPDEARKKYVSSVELIQNSIAATEERKTWARLAFIGEEVLIALKKNQIAIAKNKAEAYREQAEKIQNPREIKNYHYLSGLIALSEKRYDNALTEFLQADQRNPRILFKIAEAYEGLGNKEKAKEFFTRTANFNEISTNYAFVRNKAFKKLAEYK